MLYMYFWKPGVGCSALDYTWLHAVRVKFCKLQNLHLIEFHPPSFHPFRPSPFPHPVSLSLPLSEFAVKRAFSFSSNPPSSSSSSTVAAASSITSQKSPRLVERLGLGFSARHKGGEKKKSFPFDARECQFVSLVSTNPKPQTPYVKVESNRRRDGTGCVTVSDEPRGGGEYRASRWRGKHIFLRISTAIYLHLPPRSRRT